MITLALNDRFPFPKKYQGMLMVELIVQDSQYILWYLNKFPNRFDLTVEAKTLLCYIEGQFPTREDEIKEAYEKYKTQNLKNLSRDRYSRYDDIDEVCVPH